MSSSRDALGADVLLLHLRRQPAEGVHHLRAAAVVQRQRQRGAGIARRGLLGPAHLVLHFGRQLVRAADVADAHVVVHHALHIALQVALQQAHQEVDLGAGPAQIVFQRKRVERQPGQADARCGLRHQLHALGALLVAQEALERTLAGPAAIAVHDDGHVLGQPLRLQRRIDGALLRVSSSMRSVRRWIQGIASRLHLRFPGGRPESIPK